MSPESPLAALTKEVISTYQTVYGNSIERIYLYGSYARGDYTEQSDVDFAAIVHGERKDLQNKLRKVWDRSSDIGAGFDMLISATVIPYDEFVKYQDSLPYYQNIVKEGYLVG